jgi:tRNA threonylcarbamoyl adenosine modification protein (Sua5/YciO/YrdC/YwlC family)
MIKTLYWDDDAAIALVAAVLQRKSVVIGSSDTVIGLLAEGSSAGAAALDTLKHRREKPYLILANPDYARKLVDLHAVPYLCSLMEQCWPGPLTLIVRPAVGVPTSLLSPQGTLALRSPDHHGLQKLLTHVPILFSTSANITGQPVPKSQDEVDAEILSKLSYLILDREERRTDTPSTLLDCTTPIPTVIRVGAYPADHIEKIIGFSVRKK